MKDQVLELYNFGISTQDIADVLGKTRNSIDIHLTTLRKEGKISQHKGIGKLLMKKAEGITKEKGINKLSVISGIGVREYYKKLGYNLKGNYMVKWL